MPVRSVCPLNPPYPMIPMIDRASRSALLATGLLCVSPFVIAADIAYDWTASGTSTLGGSGTWDDTGTNWWTGSTAVAAGSAGSPFGTDTDSATLGFSGSGTITKSGTANFGATTNRALTNTLSFLSGSNYTILGAADNSALIGTGFGHLAVKVASGTTVTFGGDGKPIRLYSGSDISNGPGLLFQGGGTVDLKSGALLRNNSGNSRMTVQDGTIVSFQSGSVYTGPSGSFSTAPTDGSRIALENGTINVDGGTLTTGYRGGVASSTSRGYGIAIGGTAASGGSATLNINSGSVIALGDPRATGTAYAGVGFGLTNTNNGGTLNLNGGTLTTSNIRSITTLSKAVLNLNGGTIVVSTDLSIADAAVTDSQLQGRLDDFIIGFNGTADNRVVIGAGGATFDTSQINTTRTNGVATIKADLQGTGNLTKIGANTLRLFQASTYSGETRIQGGTFALTADASINNSAAIVIDNSAEFNVSALAAGFALSSGQKLATQSTGTVTGTVTSANGIFDIAGVLTITGDITAGAGTVFAFDLGVADARITGGGAYVIDSGATLDLSNASAFGIGSYTLLEATSVAGSSLQVNAGAYTGFDYSFTNTGTSLVLNVTSTIPEPSAFAVVLGVIALGGASLRRRSRA